MVTLFYIGIVSKGPPIIYYSNINFFNAFITPLTLGFQVMSA